MSKDRKGKSLEDRVGKEKADLIKKEMSFKRKGSKRNEECKKIMSEKASLQKNIEARNKQREEIFNKKFLENKETILSLKEKGFTDKEILKRSNYIPNYTKSDIG